MREIRRGRRILRNWVILLTCLAGIAGCTVATSPKPPASEPIKAWTYEQAVQQCYTLDVEWIKPCLTAAQNTEWSK